MSLGSGCNANTYYMLVIATHVMSYPNLSATYQLLSKLQGQIRVQGCLSRGSPQVVEYLQQAAVMIIAIVCYLLPPTLCPGQS